MEYILSTCRLFIDTLFSIVLQMVLCCIYIFRDEVIVQIQKAFIGVHSKRGEVEGNTMIIDQRAIHLL